MILFDPGKVKHQMLPINTECDFHVVNSKYLVMSVCLNDEQNQSQVLERNTYCPVKSRDLGPSEEPKVDWVLRQMPSLGIQ
jgi:hypothetical protein